MNFYDLYKFYDNKISNFKNDFRFSGLSDFSNLGTYDYIYRLYVFVFYELYPKSTTNMKLEYYKYSSWFIHKVNHYSEYAFIYYLIVLPFKYLIMYPIKYLIVYPLYYVIKYLIIIPIKWMITYFLAGYVELVCFFHGERKVLGWDPIFVKANNITWGFHTPVTLPLPYHEFKAEKGGLKYKYGYSVSENGALYRNVSPQMIYADPKHTYATSKQSINGYYDYLQYKKQLLILDPDEVVFYHKIIKWYDFEVIKWNIQMDISFLGITKIDFLMILFSIIFILFSAILYYVHYHIRRYQILLKRVEYFLEDNDINILIKYRDLRLYDEPNEICEEELELPPPSLPSSEFMNRQWHETHMHPFNDFPAGEEIHGFFLRFWSYLADLCYIIIAYIVWSFIYKQYRYYIHDFYCYNEILFSYLFIIMSFFICVYHYFKKEMETKIFLYQWEDIDWNTCDLYIYYYKGIIFINIVKLLYLNEAPYIYAAHLTVISWTIATLYIYFEWDELDRFMGWDQSYRRDVYENERREFDHWWYPRLLMNQGSWHWYMIVCRPWHFRFVLWIMPFVLIVFIIWVVILKFTNRIHVYIHNKFFWWNTPRFTIDEIQAQWKQDRVHNYVYYERHKHGGWLIIL